MPAETKTAASDVRNTRRGNPAYHSKPNRMMPIDTVCPRSGCATISASATTAALAGIALNGGANGQPVKVAVGGSLNPGFTVGVGSIYVQSATPGGIAPVADLTTGMYSTIVGMGLTASSLKLLCQNSGVAVP